MFRFFNMGHNMNKVQLTVIGGGSVNWMRKLMRDVYLIDEIDGGEIRLVDPLKEHTEAVADMLRTFNRVTGQGLQYTHLRGAVGSPGGSRLCALHL